MRLCLKPIREVGARAKVAEMREYIDFLMGVEHCQDEEEGLQDPTGPLGHLVNSDLLLPKVESFSITHSKSVLHKSIFLQVVK